MTPTCPISLFIQPKTFDNDILVLEGDIRRVIVPYVNILVRIKEKPTVKTFLMIKMTKKPYSDSAILYPS